MTSGHFTFPVIFAVFAALLSAAPAAAAEFGVYNNVSEEADFLHKRAAEWDAKKNGFLMQAENDDTESDRLEAQAKRLEAWAEEVVERAQQAEDVGDDKEAARLEKAAETLEDKASRLDRQADDLQDTANQSEDAAKNATRRAERARELADVLASITGRWQCEDNFGGDHWLKNTENNKADIEIEPSERHGFRIEVYDLLPDYDYAEQARLVAEYVFTREKELEQSYEFRMKAARLFSGKYGGKWKISRDKNGEIALFFEQTNGLVETGELEFSDRAVEIDSLFGNDPVPNWRSAPALEAEVRRMESEVAQIFNPPKGRWEFSEPEDPDSFGRALSWWNKRCERIGQ